MLAFLRDFPSERLFLLGDIVDFWAMARGGVVWTAPQNTVVQKILRRARHGEHVVLIPGNHDEALREYVGVRFGEIEVRREVVHELADGRRLLLTHGDDFDQVTRYHRWIAKLGDAGYDALVRVNVALSWVRRRLGIAGYWSLAGYAKRRVKTVVNFINDFEDSVLHAARSLGAQGVICGHIHWPELREVDGLTYANCGDWVDSCSAIVEHLDGRLELIHYGRARVAAAA